MDRLNSQKENSSSNKDKVTIGLAEPTNPKTNARIESLKRISNNELSNLRPYLCKKVQISGFAGSHQVKELSTETKNP